MNVFVLGTSESGKTPFARELARCLGLKHVMASSWVRSSVSEPLPTERNESTRLLTDASLEMMAQNQAACLEYLRASNDLTVASVIEGLRNPHDFIHLYRPGIDCVVILEYTGEKSVLPTVFDEGVEVTKSYVSFVQKCGVLPGTHVVRYSFPLFYPANKDEPGRPVAQDQKESGGLYRATSLEQAMTDFVIVEGPRLGL